MYRPRLLGWQDTCAFHVVSRTAGQEFLFGDREREVFSGMLHRAARFCGFEVLTWCCMSNHFHMLARVSKSQTEELKARLRADETALLRHLQIIYPKQEVKRIAAEWAQWRQRGMDAVVRESVDRILARIGVLATFMKELKQRYTLWFNARHLRSGTLWDARFRSVLVENQPQALRTVAGYIDLNPVRAGLVQDPKDYRWCGYGQAIGGVIHSRKGICAMMQMQAGGRESESANCKKSSAGWRSVQEDYRILLFGRAVAIAKGGKLKDRDGVALEEVEAVVKAGGALPAHERFRLRLRHFTEGTALGSADFLRGVVTHYPGQVGPKRKTAARQIPTLDADGVFSLRDLGLR